MHGSLARWTIGFALVAAMVSAGAASEPVVADSNSGRFLATSDEPLTQYRAYRRMHARSERFNQEGWLEAWTELKGGAFSYEIVTERGSDQVRTRVLKALLKREQEMVAAGDVKRSELTPANYEFTDDISSDPGVRYVLIKPKRKDTMLVDGRMVFSQDSNELLRVEGRLAKNPSFWTSLVNIVRRYARLDGVRVPIATESVAKVKMIGESRMEVHYEYETINGRPVSRQARQLMASNAR
jgi:hypothetical protein